MNSEIQLKIVLRTHLKQCRNNVQGKTRLNADISISEKILNLPQVKSADHIFCYLSHDSEVDTHNVIRMLQSQGKDILVPKITKDKQMIAVYLESWEELEPELWGILSPRSSQIMQVLPDVCITPGLGFSLNGERLGFGLGYYDSWLANNKVKTIVGIAYEQQIVEHIPTTAKDIAMDVLITEQRTIYL